METSGFDSALDEKEGREEKNEESETLLFSFISVRYRQLKDNKWATKCVANRKRRGRKLQATADWGRRLLIFDGNLSILLITSLRAELSLLRSLPEWILARQKRAS